MNTMNHTKPVSCQNPSMIGIRIVLVARVLLLLLAWPHVARALAAEPRPSDVTLTEDQKVWIRAHPVVRLGVDPEFAPFEFLTDEGDYQGMAAEHLRLIGERVGIKLQPVLGLTWSEAWKVISSTSSLQRTAAYCSSSAMRRGMGHPYGSDPRGMTSFSLARPAYLLA